MGDHHLSAVDARINCDMHHIEQNLDGIGSSEGLKSLPPDFGRAGSSEGAMRSINLIESSFHRVLVMAAATSLVMLALLASKSYYFRTAETAISSRIDVKRPAPDTAAKIEETSFVTSPTIDTNPFFFGTGDGSNGYYAERPAETVISSRIDVKQPAPDAAAKTEQTSFVTSPTIDTNPFFFGGLAWPL
jgi:hypothetical protein